MFALLSILLAQNFGVPIGPVYSAPNTSVGVPFFEFASASGVGMPAACSGGSATGTKGETVTFVRASSATCLKGNQYSGIAPGDMVNSFSNNVIRTSPGGGTTLLVYQERAITNINVQSEDFSAAAYTSTATVTANTNAAPDNGATADQLSDVSAVAIQSSCQAIATTSATPFAASVFLRAGTLAKASVRLTGTGSSTGDCVASTTTLSGSTYTRLECDSPAAYAGTLTSVTACVEVGTVVADTGTVIAWGLQVETTATAGAGATSYVPTTAAAANRASENTTLTLPVALPIGAGSIAVTALLFGAQQGNTGLVGAHNAVAGTFDTMIHGGGGGADLYVGASARTSTTPTPSFVLFRSSGFWGGSTSLTINGATVTGGAATPSATLDRVSVGSYLGANLSAGLFGAICLDSKTGTCK